MASRVPSNPVRAPVVCLSLALPPERRAPGSLDGRVHLLTPQRHNMIALRVVRVRWQEREMSSYCGPLNVGRLALDLRTTLR
ncbi:MAG TPA: hypothetical protein VFV38_30600 [Ktedonobacteraceae bacterium]|nr:hypothetical protein [Ktedonobacteraceae bacterium]